MQFCLYSGKRGCSSPTLMRFWWPGSRGSPRRGHSGNGSASWNPKAWALGNTALTTSSFSTSCVEHVEYTSRSSLGSVSACCSAFACATGHAGYRLLNSAMRWKLHKQAPQHVKQGEGAEGHLGLRYILSDQCHFLVWGAYCVVAQAPHQTTIMTTQNAPKPPGGPGPLSPCSCPCRHSRVPGGNVCQDPKKVPDQSLFRVFVTCAVTSSERKCHR